MLIALPELDRMPRTARMGVLFTVAGWCCFLFAIYTFYDPNSFIKFAIAGGIVCYFLYQSKAWARVLAMLSSVFIVAYGGFFAFLFASWNPVAMAVSVANVVLFAASFYYLALPETRQHFRKDIPDKSSDESGPSDPPTPGE